MTRSGSPRSLQPNHRGKIRRAFPGLPTARASRNPLLSAFDRLHLDSPGLDRGLATVQTFETVQPLPIESCSEMPPDTGSAEHLRARRVLPPIREQNCFGLSSPETNRVRDRRRAPSPPRQDHTPVMFLHITPFHVSQADARDTGFPRC
jgi:hypothetical protein